MATFPHKSDFGEALQGVAHQFTTTNVCLKLYERSNYVQNNSILATPTPGMVDQFTKMFFFWKLTKGPVAIPHLPAGGWLILKGLGMRTKLNLSAPPHGWGVISFEFFTVNCTKCPDILENSFCQAPTHQERGNQFTKNNLLLIVWNVQIWTEESSGNFKRFWTKKICVNFSFNFPG